jgi:hypothetical protein
MATTTVRALRSARTPDFLGARRIALVGATLAIMLAAAFAAPAARAVSSAQIVGVINVERAANGLPPVREDTALSAGCAQYDNYRRVNGSLENAFTLHGESPGSPSYTVAGAKAAKDSLVNAGDRFADSFAAGDVFDDAPNHLVALMDPSVTSIGADQTDFQFGFFGTVHLSCVDVRSSPPRPKPRHLRVYVYRGPRGRVPGTHAIYREGPSGLGSLVVVYFDAPPRVRVALRSLLIRERTGVTKAVVDLTVSGGLRKALRRASRAVSKHVAESPTPTAQFRVPGTKQETPAQAEERASIERKIEELNGEHKLAEEERRKDEEREHEEERRFHEFLDKTEEEARDRLTEARLRAEIELARPGVLGPKVSESEILFR